MMEEDFGFRESLEEMLSDPNYQRIKRDIGPQFFHRDGKPIVSTELMPDFLQWALLFETENRTVAVDKTIYGERLSTVFLGMDHSFTFSPGHRPILFETMLFAPRNDELRKKKRDQIRNMAEEGFEKALENWQELPEEEDIKKRYPHDQLQIRYATERAAKDKHEELKLQCLIPPRWRRFLLYTIGEDDTWE
jgi:hypothetical protein